MSLVTELDKKETSLTGSRLTDEDIKQLIEHLPRRLLPSWLLSMLQNYRLAGTCFSLGEDDDESGLGADLKWFKAGQMLEESLSTYPGKVVLELDYIPVAACLAGSGDPYFLKISAGNEDPPLVCIPHDLASDEDAYPESEIEIVCNSLSQFFCKSEIN